MSLLEPHGLYDGASEQTVGSNSRIASLKHIEQSGYDLVIVKTLAGAQTVLAISYVDDPARRHRATVDGREISWKGYSARIVLSEGEN